MTFPGKSYKAVHPAYPGEVYYLGTRFRAVIDWDDPYVRESLEHPVRYIQIERKMFPSGWRYYAALYLDGDAREIAGTCRRRKRLLKALFRKKAAYTKQSHEELANRLVEGTNTFNTEEMDFI